jgi:hypothetical protein
VEKTIVPLSTAIPVLDRIFFFNNEQLLTVIFFHHTLQQQQLAVDKPIDLGVVYFSP